MRQQIRAVRKHIQTCKQKAHRSRSGYQQPRTTLKGKAETAAPIDTRPQPRHKLSAHVALRKSLLVFRKEFIKVAFVSHPVFVLYLIPSPPPVNPRIQTL